MGISALICYLLVLVFVDSSFSASRQRNEAFRGYDSNEGEQFMFEKEATELDAPQTLVLFPIWILVYLP